MNLRICILPSQPLKDGRHKIRIAISHNNETRYFVTNQIISSATNFKNGQVTGKESGAREINMRAHNFMQEIQAAYDTIEGAEYYSCSELMDIIKDRMRGVKPKTIIEVLDIIIENKRLQGRKKSTLSTYNNTRNVLIRHFGEKRTIESLTHRDLLLLKSYMDSAAQMNMVYDDDKLNKQIKYGLSSGYQHEVFAQLKYAYNYAVNQRYFTPSINIWLDFEIPSHSKRDCDISIEELRRIRDADFKNSSLNQARDILMLSFYLCGMNLVDLYRQDLSKPIICYRRVKTENSRNKNEVTEFTIQPEARALIDKYSENGRFCFRGLTIGSAKGELYRKLILIKKDCQIEGRLIFYSFRKTFAQLCLVLGVPDAIIAYCIGDTPPTKVLNTYRAANRQLADVYIRRVFDFVASDKSVDDIINDL